MSDVMKERFAAAAKQLDGMDLMALGRRMVQNEIELEKIKGEKAILEAEKEVIRLRLAEVMAEQKVPRFAVEYSAELTRRINVKEVLSVTTPAGIAQKVQEILKDNGQGGLIKETVEASTFKKFVEGLRKKGEDGMPDPLLVQLVNAGVKISAKDQAGFY